METTIIAALVLALLFAVVLLLSSRDAVAELAGVLLLSSRDAVAKFAGVASAAGKAMDSLSFISARTDSSLSGRSEILGCKPILRRLVFVSSCNIGESLACIQRVYGKDCFLSGGIILAVCFEKGVEKPLIEECTAKISKFFCEGFEFCFCKCRLLEPNPDDEIMKYRINPELRRIANTFGDVVSSGFSAPPSGNEMVVFGYEEFKKTIPDKGFSDKSSVSESLG